MSNKLEFDDFCRVAPSGESSEVNAAGLAESNGILPPGGWLKDTCGLTACTPGSAPGSTLGKEYVRTLPLLHAVMNLQVSSCVSADRLAFNFHRSTFFEQLYSP